MAEPRQKYPRTYHFWHSPGLQNDDRQLTNYDGFRGKRVRVSLKYDGENTSMYRDGLHARSLDSAHHPSRTVVKAIHGEIAHQIPVGMRVCGENTYARHSIAYADLPAYFMVFNIWLGSWCCSTEETSEYAELLGLPEVPVIYDGVFDLQAIDAAFAPYADTHEGWVCRVTHGFDISDFHQYVGKWVRRNHVQTDAHWMSRPVEPNTLRSADERDQTTPGHSSPSP